MQLQSSAFSNGDRIPSKYTCDGENISPPLEWHNSPMGTASFALIVEDPDAPQPAFTHWIVYNLPLNLRLLPEGIDGQPHLPDGGMQGKNDFGNVGFGGPCPPSGTHRYFFRLFALDQPLHLEPGVDRAALLSAMENHVLDSVGLMGRYCREEASSNAI